jgi:hypothetical protein
MSFSGSSSHTTYFSVKLDGNVAVGEFDCPQFAL